MTEQVKLFGTADLKQPEYLTDLGTDVYGSRYVSDGEVVEIIPETNNFEEYFMHIVGFSNNFSNLINHGVLTPNFEAGVDLDSMEPYFLTAYIDGQPVGEVALTDEELQKVAEYNDRGRRLAGQHMIMYSEPFQSEDYMVDDTVIVCNPGTYVPSLSGNQFNKSPNTPNEFILREFSSEYVWEKIRERDEEMLERFYSKFSE